MADHVLMSKLLKELDEVIGCAFREWIVDENVLLQKRRTSFFLTGTVLSEDNDHGLEIFTFNPDPLRW